MTKHLGRNPFDRKKAQTKNPGLSEGESVETSSPRPLYGLLVNLSTRSIVFALKAAMVVRTVVQRNPKSKHETEHYD